MKPNTRKEMFLDAIADGEPCNLVPANRKELLLQRIAESVGGGGGGSDVVVNCTMCYDDSVPSRIDGDFATVLSAINAGKNVRGYMEFIENGKVSGLHAMYLSVVRYDPESGEAGTIEFLDSTRMYLGILYPNPEDNYIGENNG